MSPEKNPVAPTAIDYLLTKIPTVKVNATVGQTLALIRSQKNWDTINYIYVLNEKKNLIGVVSIKELLRNENKITINKIMIKNPAGTTTSASPERASIIAIKNNIKAVPVFRSGTKKFLGVIGNDKILKNLHQKHVEDFLRFSGITKDRLAVDVIKANTFTLFKLRLPWLLLGLLGGILAAKIVASFEGILQAHLILAMFIPVIVYMGDAVGTQTETLFIRGLALEPKLLFKNYLPREIKVVALIASVCGIFLALITLLWWQTIIFSIIIGVSMFLTIFSAAFTALLIPWFFTKFKKDPALGSGPFATIIQDILSLVIYFSIASILLKIFNPG